MQYLCDNDIPFYLYSIEEFEQLAGLAQERGTVPEHRRGTFSLDRGLEFVDETWRAQGPPAPEAAATRDREENPLMQHDHDPAWGEESGADRG